MFPAFPAGNKVSLAIYFFKFLLDSLANPFCKRAPRVKRTSRRRVHNAWHLAAEPLPLSPEFRVNLRNRRHQGFGVWVKRIVIKLLRVSLFHNSAHIHNSYNVAEKLYNRKVMRNKQIC